MIALKWTDIKKNTIHIQRQEICYTLEDENEKKTIHEIVDYTKTEEGDRILPLSPDALKILDNLKKWNKDSVRQFAGHKNIQTTFNSYYKDISSNTEFYGEMCACL